MSDSLAEQFQDLDRRRESHRRWYYARRPKRIDNVIAQLVSQRGYAQVRAAGKRDAAWQQAVGENGIGETQVGSFRRGVFEVLVANSLLMQELTFQKEQLLAKLREALPDEKITQLKFRIAQIGKAQTEK